MKNLLKKDRASGFTIIEVMIVLAIAGLIMVIVFIAIPQLQRNQRDNARQNLANRIEAELETFAGNNQGEYPFSTAARTTNFIDNYFNNLPRNNPRTGTPYTLMTTGGILRPATYATDPGSQDIAVYPDGRCDGETAVGGTITNLNSRSVAVRIQLDNGNTYYCVDNS